MDKEILYLTHIVFHRRKYRPTTLFSKIARKGIMYLPMTKSANNIQAPIQKKASTIVIKLPDDLFDRFNRNELDIMIPECGPLLCAGKDIEEYLEKRQQQQHRKQLIHKGRTWHAKNDKGMI